MEKDLKINKRVGWNKQVGGKKKRILKTSRTDQRKIERSLQGDAITDNNVWENKSKNEVPTDSEIERVKIIHNRAFQGKDAAFRTTTPQAILIIEKNQKALQDDGTRGECGRTRCTNRSKCFRDRYRSQKYTNNLYLLVPCHNYKEVTRGDIWEKP